MKIGRILGKGANLARVSLSDFVGCVPLVGNRGLGHIGTQGLGGPLLASRWLACPVVMFVVVSGGLL